MRDPIEVVAVVSNLFFATRIEATGRQVGVGVTTASPERAIARCREIEPRLVLLDLEAPADPATLAAALKGEPVLAHARIVAFYPHVRDDLRQAAVAAGLDQVLPRSAFHNRLADLLRDRGAATPAPEGGEPG